MNRATEIKVGALVLAAAALLAVMVLVVGDFSWQNGQEIKVDYVFVGSLQPGASVRSSGIKVGKVQSIEFMGGQVSPQTGEPIQIRLTLWIEDRALNNVRGNSRFLINTEGMLGEQYVEIIPGTAVAPRLEPDAVVRGDDPPRTDLLMQRAYQLVEVLSKIMVDNSGKFDKMLESMSRLLATSDSLLNRNKDQIGPLFENMNRLMAELDKALSSTGDMRIIIDNTKEITTQFRRDVGPMSAQLRVALDDLAIAGKNTVMLTDPNTGSLAVAAGAFHGVIGHADRGLDEFEQSLEKFDRAIAKVEHILARAEQGPAKWVLGDDEDVEEAKQEAEAKKKAKEESKAETKVEPAPAPATEPVVITAPKD